MLLWECWGYLSNLQALLRSTSWFLGRNTIDALHCSSSHYQNGTPVGKKDILFLKHKKAETAETVMTTTMMIL
jgi:hypothetical protein